MTTGQQRQADNDGQDIETMNLKSTIFKVYLGVGIAVCVWFTVAAANAWRAPNMGMLDGSSSGRSYGGSWGGGK